MNVVEITTDQLEEYMTQTHIAIEKNNPKHIVKKTQFGLFTVHKDGLVSELKAEKYASSRWIVKETI